MSKFNQIQNELRQLDGGAFQKLADNYLYKKGYEKINPLGSVIGANKPRPGTPDTLVMLPNGKYVFVEHTTQQEGVAEKFKKDLNKCFDESKTGISVEKIQEVVLCHTSMLTTDETDKLIEECQKRGVNLNIFGIGPISHDLYQKYPGIARDFLGVEVDTGQIVDVDEFVNSYNRNAAAPLNTTFHFREKELEEVLQGLENSNLVIVSGKAGVGKSRLSLECCNQFLANHPEYQVKCIFRRVSDIFEDLRVYFSEPGCHLIFVDDANRLSSFDYFIDLLHHQRDDQKIKIIATVRDYALEKIEISAQSYKNSTEVELNSLDENQIKQIVKDEYEILNPLYLNRIAEIAQGNPRLAIMAAKIAKTENRLDSINNVSNLYDEYYSSIRNELQELGDENLLKAAGIVAFFRTVDRSNEEMMEAIETAFGMNQEVFCKAVCQLHDHEFLDMYENEIVRISDQILGTYLFYLAFFKDKLLNFSTLLNYFFPQLKSRFVDALNPVLNTFDSEKIIEVIRPSVDQSWKKYQNAGDEKNLMQFIQVFWFLKKTDTLVYVHEQISAIEPEPVDFSKLEIKPNSAIPSLSLLNIIGLFNHSDEDNLKMALELLLQYVKKRPTEIGQVVYLLTERFGFEYESYRYGFAIQQIVIDVLWEQVKDGEDVIFSKLFLVVAEHYLHTEFDSTKMKGRAINFFQFTLPAKPELSELRQKIWQRVFQLYQIAILQKDVLSLLYKYSTSGYKVSVDQIIIQDSFEVLPFIESNMDVSSYDNCQIVQIYLNKLEGDKLKISTNDNHNWVIFKQFLNLWRYLLCEDLRCYFTNPTYAISEILLTNRHERKYLNLGYEEYEQIRQKRIQDFFINYTLDDYKQFFEQCIEIQEETVRRNHNEFSFPHQVARVFIAIANINSQLYAEVIQYYLSFGNPFKINDPHLINHLIIILGIDKTYQIINQADYALKQKWLFDFYRLLPQQNIRNEHLDQLYHLYRESKASDLPGDLNFILKYQMLNENVLPKIIEILLVNSSENSNKSYPLSSLFDRYEVTTDLLNLLDKQFNLLKQAYLQVLKNDPHIDDKGQYFAYILKRDPEFIIEYIDWIYQQKEQLYRFDDTRTYSFLWRSENYEIIMSQIIEYIDKRNQEKFKLSFIELDNFFILSEDDKDQKVLWERQDNLLMRILESKIDEFEFVKFIFYLVTNFSHERRRSFVEFFIKHNKKFEYFKKLSLEPSSWSSSGSWVPVYQRRVEYLDSLLTLFNSIDFLQHKQYIEQHIQWLREEIEREKKNNFMSD
ncbi:MAG: hypothetical protein AN482_19540 [Anabaena sp. LE011-02]|nr:MAG: hypothetical protein AN482_19540 [Anabaena sp. LE011-02]